MQTFIPKTTVSNSLQKPQTKAGVLNLSKPLQRVCGQTGKKATHKCSRAEGGFSGPVSKPNSVGCYRQLNSSSLHKQTKRKIMTWCHHYQITLKARHIPGCLSRLNQVQSTEWSLHSQVFKQICQKRFTPHVELFATRTYLQSQTQMLGT